MPTKNQSIEYRLLVRPTFDSTVNKEGILFLLETSKQFTNFSYVIDVKETILGRKIVWTLRGLRAPSMNMPSTGAAQYSNIYFDLDNKIDFMLVKNEKATASTSLKFLRSSVKSTKTIVNFLKIYTDEIEFENNRLTDADVPELKPDIHRGHEKTKKLIKRQKNK
ncbi:MAG: hypothetical protein Q8L88_06795 [Bacteroidota bacterium]|nr:hypothetical protein [Bacteroidota bacterium]